MIDSLAIILVLIVGLAGITLGALCAVAAAMALGFIPPDWTVDHLLGVADE